VLAVELAREDQLELEKIVADLGTEAFTASDSLGWCYQFWQAEKKEAVNESGVKIGADELPAVTQLFTEDYMVDFLLDNTLGAWWAGKVFAADPSIAASATTEDELRKAVSLPGVPWAHLRFIKYEGGAWRTAAGTFDGWPKATKELTCLDPCMGSGHFVVAMFARLVPLRMREEGLSETAAIQAVIRDNLYGLEIDPRCTQIGAFNLALAAWRRVGHCSLPPMHIACSGLAPNSTEAEWVALAEGNYKIEEGMRRLHGLFKDAPVLGSLINPRAEGYTAFEASFAELQPILEKALAKEGSDDAEHEMAVTARGVAKAAEVLGRQFALVATNVPYLGRGKQNETLGSFIDQNYPQARADLATAFIERALDIAAKGGTSVMVTPQIWLFLTTYKKLRHRLLSHCHWTVVVTLGTNAFQDMNWWAATTALVGFTRDSEGTTKATFALNVGHDKRQDIKSKALVSLEPVIVSGRSLRSSPESRFTFFEASALPLLASVADCLQGISTADNPRFVRFVWEGASLTEDFRALQGTIPHHADYLGREQLLWLGPLEREIKTLGAALRGQAAWGKRAVLVNRMGGLLASLMTGEMFDINAAAIVPHDPTNLAAIFTFCRSPSFAEAVRRADPKMNVTNATLGKVPFDLDLWRLEASKLYPNGLPTPFSSDQTQWLFNGYPKDSDSPLHVAVARLVGYQWPRQTGSEFPDCPSLGPDGLESHADADGIVCLSSVRGEPTAADRLLTLLADAYGPDWSADLRDKLLADVDATGTTLDDWLRDSFFEQHLKLFHQRPFVWHIWDGLREGFNCLVNYHKLVGPGGEGRRTLEKITYEYLGDWIARQKAQQAAGEEGADARVAAAVHLQEQLAKIIEGEPPFDIFVRWKPLTEQAIGWDPDINDGVRLNIRPFMTARPLGARGKKACILRAAPGIKWDKDRGTEPNRPKDQFPWFWTWDGESQDFAGGPKFDGNRHNDLHYTRKVKEAARAKAASGKPREART